MTKNHWLKYGIIIFGSLIILLHYSLFIKDEVFALELTNIEPFILNEQFDYVLDFNYEINNIDKDKLFQLASLDKNKEIVEWVPTINYSNKSILIQFHELPKEVDYVVLSILVDMKASTYKELMAPIELILLKEVLDTELSPFFVIRNGEVWLCWEVSNYEQYEVYSVIVDEVTGSRTEDLLIETSLNEVLLTMDTNYLSSGYIVRAKNGEQKISSQVLSSCILINQFPINLLELPPSEINQISDLKEFLTVEMFGGGIVELPIFYEWVDKENLQMKVINSVIQKQIISYNSKIKEELIEEINYRMMMYPTHYWEDEKELVINPNYFSLEVNFEKNTTISINRIIHTSMQESMEYLFEKLQWYENEISIKEYPRLLAANKMQESLNNWKKQHPFLVVYLGGRLVAEEGVLQLTFDSSIEPPEKIAKRLDEVRQQLDGSLESIYYFLVTDTFYPIQSNYYTASAFHLLAKDFGYQVQLVKGSENGVETYWNSVEIEGEKFFIDITKNQMTTGKDFSLFLIRENDLVERGMQIY